MTLPRKITLGLTAAIVVLIAALAITLSLPTHSASADQSLDSEELAFVTLINNYRASQSPPLGALTIDWAMQPASDWMSLDMGLNGYFDHYDHCTGDCVNGHAYDPTKSRDPWVRMCQIGGYCYNAWKGENIAAGYTTAQAVFTAWQNSPGHNANMLGVNYTSMGLARVFVAGSPYGWYWTNDFGSVRSGTPPPSGATNTPAPTASPTRTPTPAPTASPTPVPTASPTPVRTPSPTPVPTASPTPVPTASPTPIPTASPTPVPTASPTPVRTPTPTPIPTASPTPIPTASPTPVRTPTPTPVAPTASPSPVRTPTQTPVPPTASPTLVRTASPTPAVTLTPTPRPTSRVPSPSATATRTATPTPTRTPVATPTRTPTRTPVQTTPTPTRTLPPLPGLPQGATARVTRTPIRHPLFSH